MNLLEKAAKVIENICDKKDTLQKFLTLCALQIFSCVPAFMLATESSPMAEVIKNGTTAPNPYTLAYEKYGIYFILMLIGYFVCSAIIYGYLTKFVNEISKGNDTTLPDFGNFFNLFVKGIKFIPGFILAILSYFAIIIFFAIVIMVVTYGKSDALAGTLVAGIAIILVLLVYYLLAAIWLSYAQDFKWYSPVNFKRIFSIAFSLKYLIACCTMIVVCLIFTAIMFPIYSLPNILACIIGIPFSIISQLIFALVFGLVLQKDTQEKQPQE